MKAWWRLFLVQGLVAAAVILILFALNRDAWENCGWGTNPTVVDSDGDTFGDCREAADVDGNGVLNFTGDAIAYAKAALLPPSSFGKGGDFDIDKNGTVNFVGDVIQVLKFAEGIEACQ